jgi:nitroreductase
MFYDQLMDLFRQRRTVRYASSTDISEDHRNKILEAAKLAPSFDKLYPYKIYALTNTEQGKLKKEALLEYFRCGTDRPFSGWKGKEILQPILSGLVLAYTWQEAISRTPDPLAPGPGYGIQDAMISATMAMMAAESLGLKTAFFSAAKMRDDARRVLSNNNKEKLLILVAISNDNLDKNPTPFNILQLIKYQGQTARILLKKHRTIIAQPGITLI